MSKEFDTLKELKHWKEINTEKGVTWLPVFVVENAEKDLIKAQEQAKVLRIMFNKTVSIFQLRCCKNVDEYNDLKFIEFEKLTQEEYDLIMRYLNDTI